MKLAIWGLGHIGGSLAEALNGRVELAVYDRDPVTRSAAVTAGLRVVDSEAELVRFDVVIFAVPTGAVFSSVKAHLDNRRASGIVAPVVVVDLASVKSGVVVPISELVRSDASVSYLSLHPMAGREGSGFGSRDPHVLEDATWAEVDTSTQYRSDLVVAVLALLSRQLRACFLPLSVELHDRSVAQVSHLPHLIALALVRQLHQSDHPPVAELLAAGSFKGATRVAATDPDRILDLCWPNRVALKAVLADFIALLMEVEGNLSEEEEVSLYRWIRSSQLVGQKRDDPNPTSTIWGGDVSEVKGYLDQIRDSGRRIAETSHEGGSVVLRTI